MDKTDRTWRRNWEAQQRAEQAERQDTIEFPAVRGGDTIKFAPVVLLAPAPLATRPSAAAQIWDGFKPLFHGLGVVLIFLLKVLFYVVVSLAFAVFFVAVVHGLEGFFGIGNKKQPPAFRPRVQA